MLDFLFCFDVDTSKPVSFFMNLIRSVICGLVRLDPVTLSDVFFESRNPGFSFQEKLYFEVLEEYSFFEQKKCLSLNKKLKKK